MKIIYPKLLKLASNTRFNLTFVLSDYGNWLYCAKCNKTIAYICYTNYNYLKFSFMCNCGSSGFLELTDVENILQDIRIAKGGLKYIQNRLCCNIDKLPIFSVVKKQLKEYEYKVICKNCGAVFEDKIVLTPASTLTLPLRQCRSSEC